jgi:hypothetical protein
MTRLEAVEAADGPLFMLNVMKRQEYSDGLLEMHLEGSCNGNFTGLAGDGWRIKPSVSRSR